MYNARLRWVDPQDADEAAQRFRVVEDRGDRVLVADEADLPQTFASYRHADDRHNGPALVPLFCYAAGDLCAC